MERSTKSASGTAHCAKEKSPVAGCEISGSADGPVAVYNFNQDRGRTQSPLDNMLLTPVVFIAMPRP